MQNLVAFIDGLGNGLGSFKTSLTEEGSQYRSIFGSILSVETNFVIFLVELFVEPQADKLEMIEHIVGEEHLLKFYCGVLLFNFVFGKLWEEICLGIR